MPGPSLNPAAIRNLKQKWVAANAKEIELVSRWIGELQTQIERVEAANWDSQQRLLERRRAVTERRNEEIASSLFESDPELRQSAAFLEKMTAFLDSLQIDQKFIAELRRYCFDGELHTPESDPDSSFFVIWETNEKSSTIPPATSTLSADYPPRRRELAALTNSFSLSESPLTDSRSSSITSSSKREGWRESLGERVSLLVNFANRLMHCRPANCWMVAGQWRKLYILDADG